MTERTSNRWLHPLLVAGLAGALLVLAFLQYRWIGEISQADRERLERNLIGAAFRFRGGFLRELGAVTQSFALPPDALAAADDRAVIADAYASWRESSDASLRISNIYLLDANLAQSLDFLRLDLATLEWQAASWPATLSSLDPLRRRARDWRRGPRFLGWNFHGPTTALIRPLFALRRNHAGLLERPVFRGVLIVQLDRAFLVNEAFPAMESRYYADAAETGYGLLIADVGPGREVENVIYASPAGIKPPRRVPDPPAAFPLFRDRNDGPPPDDNGGRRPPRGRQPGEAPPPSWQFLTEIAPLGPESDWRLIAKYREGSLDAVVNRLRRRNLTISSAILLLLACGLGLVIVSARRAERLARLQMEFVAGVSHELRTPLAVIRSAGDNLAEGVVAAPEQVREYGALIRDEGRRLTEMVERTLSFSAIESGRAQYRVEDAGALEWLQQSIAEIRPSLEGHGVSLEFETPETLPAVRIDRSAATQSFHNLVQNALKYGQGARWIRVTAEPHDGFIRVTVADRGIGIPADEIERIFEPFFRGREAADRQIQGAGLGLSLARRAAEAFGGKLTAESQAGIGSRFFLDLPIAGDRT